MLLALGHSISLDSNISNLEQPKEKFQCFRWAQNGVYQLILLSIVPPPFKTSVGNGWQTLTIHSPLQRCSVHTYIDRYIEYQHYHGGRQTKRMVHDRVVLIVLFSKAVIESKARCATHFWFSVTLAPASPPVIQCFPPRTFLHSAPAPEAARPSQGSTRAPQALSSADTCLNWKLTVCQHFALSLKSPPAIPRGSAHLWLFRRSQHLKADVLLNHCPQLLRCCSLPAQIGSGGTALSPGICVTCCILLACCSRLRSFQPVLTVKWKVWAVKPDQWFAA